MLAVTRKEMLKILRIKKKIQQVTKKILVIITGSVLTAISYNTIVVPNGLLSGGISGLALIGKYTLKVPLYIGIAILNIPIFFSD